MFIDGYGYGYEHGYGQKICNVILIDLNARFTSFAKNKINKKRVVKLV